MPLVNEARSHGISAEMYPDAVKMKKQMIYANAKQIAFVAIAGENEMKENKITLKNMETGEQMLVPISDFMDVFSEQRK
ncbi:histidyl-tRNA synthetase [Chlamydia trachomatis]|nr:histidyl-tRNA synthetase [Chlamydia trachomatis]